MYPSRNAIGETFYYASSMPNDFFEIHLCGRTPAVPNYRILRTDNPVYVLEYVISGKGWMNIDQKVHTVCAGDFYFIRKGASAHYRSDPDDPYEKIWINADGKLLDQLTAIYQMNDSLIVRPQSDLRVHDLITGIHNRLLGITEENHAELIRACSVDIAAIFSIVMQSETLESGNLPATTAERMKHYIDAQLYRDITLESIAAHFHLHEVYAIRLFGAHYGVTPMKYLASRRIEVAKRMILDGSMTFKEIAAALHFADGSYFSSRFRKETGLSPSEYRRRMSK